jgi:ABC-type nitrate/sulfonate/bicarbonate transport system substrate-binding protein
MTKLWNCVVGTAAAIGMMMISSAHADAPIKMSVGTGIDPSFGQIFVAKEGGIFEKNGLDVTIQTGSSGSAMIPFLIGNNVQAVNGSDLAGIINHNIDHNIIAVADCVAQVHWQSVVGKDIADMAGLKGKTIGITKGTSGEIFWAAVVAKLRLNQSDYTFVNIEAPEELAAMQRGDVNAFVAWEPWPTRAVQSIKGAKILIDNSQFVSQRSYIYMYRPWIAQNPDAAVRFMRSIVESTDFINQNPDKAAVMIAKIGQLPVSLTKELMPKLEYTMEWTESSIQNIQAAISTLQQQGKMKAPLNWNDYVDTDLLKKVRPSAIKISALPPT